MPSRHIEFVLLESTRGHWNLPVGLALSVVAHVAIITAAVQATTRGPGSELEAPTESVRYLIPFDKILRAPVTPSLEPHIALTWGEGDGTGGGNAAELSRVLDRTAKPEADAAGRGRDTGGEQLVLPVIANLLHGDTIRSELEVDSTVERTAESAAPAYPADLLAQNVEGEVRVQFVVDTSGRVDPASFRIVASSHYAFADAVRVALPGMKFRPAKMRERAVPQLVEQPFSFRIAKPDEQSAGQGRAPAVPSPPAGSP